MTRTFDRMGLGLCIAERYAHLNGWEIRVDSVPGEGSTFTVILWRGISRCTPGRSRL
jgi:light-regulated signal transduction histidine kinase (bacteriophytochrome)